MTLKTVNQLNQHSVNYNNINTETRLKELTTLPHSFLLHSRPRQQSSNVKSSTTAFNSLYCVPRSSYVTSYATTTYTFNSFYRVRFNGWLTPRRWHYSLSILSIVFNEADKLAKSVIELRTFNSFYCVRKNATMMLNIVPTFQFFLLCSGLRVWFLHTRSTPLSILSIVFCTRWR